MSAERQFELRRCLVKQSVRLAWVIGLLVVFALTPPGAAATSLPSAPLSLVGGGTLNLQSLKGQVVVIRFLASW